MSDSGWLRRKTGGLPHWLMVVIIGVVVALVGVSANGLLARAEVDAARESNRTPMPTFPAHTPAVPVYASFFGDSFTTGAGASALTTRWTSLVSKELGWRETNLGLGGTGFVATSGQRGCGRDFCPAIGEAITEATGLIPGIIVISGGRNDAGLTTADVVSVVTAALQKYPDAQIVLTSPIWDDDPAPAEFFTRIEAVRAAAAESGATFIDLGEPLTGKPEIISRDGVHPNDAGYAAIAAAFEAAWRQ